MAPHMLEDNYSGEKRLSQETESERNAVSYVQITGGKGSDSQDAEPAPERDKSPPINWKAIDDFKAQSERMRIEKHQRFVTFMKQRRPMERIKTLEEQDAANAAELSRLGAEMQQASGASSPSDANILKDGLQSNGQRTRGKGDGLLRRALLGSERGLQASKKRDEQEKAASRKRGLDTDSSDEEGGRSSLGKSKKQRPSTTAVLKAQDSPFSSAPQVQAPSSRPTSLGPTALELPRETKTFTTSQPPDTLLSPKTSAKEKRARKKKNKKANELQDKQRGGFVEAPEHIQLAAAKLKLKDRLRDADDRCKGD